MRLLLIWIFGAFTIGLSTPASAGVFGDDLSRCLVTRSTETDQRVLMRWMFAAFSLDPSLSPLARISSSERSQITSSAAQVYNRLLLVDCHKEAVAALKTEGTEVLGPSFGVLGKAAANRLFKSPAAEAELDKLSENFDLDGVEKLLAEAGIHSKETQQSQPKK